MENIPESKSFLIYIKPSQEISDLFEQVSRLLCEKHPNNTYTPMYKGKWHSHLMVYLSPMPSANQEQIINVTRSITKDLTPFYVTLNEIEIAEANYLYVNLTKDATRILESTHEKLVVGLAPFRDKTIKEKYLLKWATFTEEEKQRIQNTGLPYKYVPHMTLGVFADRSEQEIAYKEVLPFDLSGKGFLANTMEILTSVGSDYNNKEIVFSENF